MRFAGFLLALFVGTFLAGTFATMAIDSIWPLGERYFGMVAWVLCYLFFLFGAWVRMVPSHHRFWTVPSIGLARAIWRPLAATARVGIWVKMIAMATYHRVKAVFIVFAGFTYLSAEAIGLPDHVSLTLSLLVATPLAALMVLEGYNILMQRPWQRPDPSPAPPMPQDDTARR